MDNFKNRIFLKVLLFTGVNKTNIHTVFPYDFILLIYFKKFDHKIFIDEKKQKSNLLDLNKNWLENKRLILYSHKKLKINYLCK